jgi:type VI protein secretion system component VasF
MELLDLYEDLFRYICVLNRWAKTDSHPDYARVRGEIKIKLDQIKKKAATQVRLMNQAARLEVPILFFIDNVISSSRLQFASQWADARLAWDRDEQSGDADFFERFLDKDLPDPSDDAEERLAVYYVCLGLGFTGKYPNAPQELLRYVNRIYPRITRFVDNAGKITQQAYNYTETTILEPEEAGSNLTLVVILFCFLCLSSAAIYYGLYWKWTHELTDSVKTILNAAQTPKP